jgi:DNA mismatch endonuclease (patch repair protein)
MADTLTPEHRSWNMSRIRSNNTKPEKIVRSLLHRMGYRFRLGTAITVPSTGPGARPLKIKPDIVLPKHKTAIFVHGCFWHRHPGCRFAYTPKSRIEFWRSKFAENVARDQRNYSALSAAGWNVITVWECQTDLLDQLATRLHGSIQRTVRYDFAWTPKRLVAAESPD